MLEIIYAAWIVVATNGMRYEYDKEPDPAHIPKDARIIESPNYKIRHDNPYTVSDNGSLTLLAEPVSEGAQAKAEAAGTALEAAKNPAITDAQFFKLIRLQYMPDADAKQAWDELKPEIGK
jgi:hypothetical protein